jgi:WD40 repeat protein
LIHLGEISSQRAFPVHQEKYSYRINDHLAMTLKFSPTHDFIEIHDSVAIVGKWASSGHIYLGCSSGALLQLSPAPRGRNSFYISNSRSSLHCLAISDIAVSADGRVIVTTSLDGSCIVTTFEDGELVVSHEIDCPEALSPHCALSSDGRVTAIVGAHGSLYVNDTTTTATGRLGDDFFREVAFYGDESRLVCLARHNLSLVNVENHAVIARLAGSTAATQGKLKKSINCLATHPRNSFVAVGTVTGWVEIYDIEREEKIRDVKVGGQLIERMEFAPDGQTLAIAQSNRGVTLMDVRNMEVSDRFEKQRSRILSVSLNTAADRLVSVSEDKTVVIVPIVVNE